MADRVTLEPAAEDYARRCKSIGLERKGVADLQDAMNHPEFKSRHHLLLDGLVAEYRQSEPFIERPPFMKVKLGTCKSNKELRKVLLDAGYKIGDWGSDILNKTEVVKEPSEVEIVIFSVAELGFSKGARRSQIYEKAISLGLTLCPSEVGLQMRLQYENQPNGEWILVAMEPIADSFGYLYVFRVGRHDDGRWLDGFHGYPDFFWAPVYRWAFCRKRSS